MSPVVGAAAEPFTALYEARYGAIHAYAARRVGLQAADEIAAETFLIAWRRFDAVPEEPLPCGLSKTITWEQDRHRITGAQAARFRADLARAPSNFFAELRLDARYQSISEGGGSVPMCRRVSGVELVLGFGVSLYFSTSGTGRRCGSLSRVATVGAMRTI